MKKSFVLYGDLWDTIKHLNKEALGELTTIIFEYVLEDKNITPENPLFFVFNPIKNTLDRDKQKYETTCEKRKIAGKKGGLSKGKQSKAKKANAKFANQTLANEADNDSVSVNDSVNDTVSVNEKNNRLLKTADEVKSKKYFNNEEVNELFIQFLINRIMLKKYPSEYSIQMLINKMRKIYKSSDEAIKGISLSIENNWSSLYELTKNTSKPLETKTFTRASQGVKME